MRKKTIQFVPFETKGKREVNTGAVRAPVPAKDYCTITCRCGHIGEFMDFCRTPIYGELRPGEYMCPKCKYAWRIEHGPVTITKWGTVISEPNRIVEIEPFL